MPLNAVAFDVAPGQDAANVAAAVQQQVPGTTAYTRAEAVALIPGIDSIGQSFGILVGLTFVIGIVVIGFFFLILTVQKLKAFTLLRAVGASTRSLAATVVWQITGVVLVASAFAAVLTWLAAQGLSTGIPVQLQPMVLISTVLAVLICALGAGLLSVRRNRPDRSRHRSREPLMPALAEIRRGEGRFAAIVAALALLVFLVLVLGASPTVFTTVRPELSAPPVRLATSSTKTPKVAGALSGAGRGRRDGRCGPWVTAAGPVGVLLTGGTGLQGPIDLAVFGIDPGGPGTPSRVVDGRLPAPGEQGVAAVDTRLQQFGVELGSTVKVGEVLAKVVGFTADSNYQLQPSLWTTVTTWRAMRDAVRPEQRGQTADVNAIAVTTDSTPRSLLSRRCPGSRR